MISALVLALSVMVLVFWAVGARRRLGALRGTAVTAFGLLVPELQQHHGAVRHMVAVLEPWLLAEQRLLARALILTERAEQALQSAQGGAVEAQQVQALTKAQRLLDAIVQGVCDVASHSLTEAKQRETLLSVRRGLGDIDVRVEFARQIFNEAVAAYNGALMVAPTRWLYRVLGLQAVAGLERHVVQSHRGGLTS